MRVIRWAWWPAALCAGMWACSTSESSNDTEVDAGTPPADAGSDASSHDGGTHADAGTDASTDAEAPDGGEVDAGTDASTEIPIRCTQAEFDQAATMPGGGDYTHQLSVEITFPQDAVPAQYTNRCIKVKFGTDVIFKGNFTAHPLEPAGGNVPTPIPSMPSPDGGVLTVKMTNTGTFGFQCNVHPAIMFGAIQVVE